MKLSRDRPGNCRRGSKEYHNEIEKKFAVYTDLRQQLREKINSFPAGGVGVYSYFQRLATGLQQLMCGARKASLKALERSDIGALTREAADLTGIKHVMELDKDEAEKILLSISRRCAG